MTPPLVLDGSKLPDAELEELVRSLRADLAETEELVLHPRGRVLQPASLETAADLLRSAGALLGDSSPASREDLRRRANLAYAVLLAVIDLVKSHTEGPTVPRSRKTKS